jgi:holo-[acyl-carrier protein] synthase
MRIIGIGLDIVEIPRLASSISRFGDRFLDRLFLPEEREYCDRFREPARCYAARFAAKEAVSKALGVGIGAELGWLDILVRRLPSGQPTILLEGPGAETARRLGATEMLLSLSHSEHYAVAQALATGC